MVVTGREQISLSDSVPVTGHEADEHRGADQDLPENLRAHARFRVGVVVCAGLLLVLLWGAVTLHLGFDKAQTTSHASLNVANLSQVVDEYLTRRIYEIDQALVA